MPLPHLLAALTLATALSACANNTHHSPTELMQQNSERAERALRQEQLRDGQAASQRRLQPDQHITPEQFFCQPSADGQDSPSCARAQRQPGLDHGNPPRN